MLVKSKWKNWSWNKLLWEETSLLSRWFHWCCWYSWRVCHPWPWTSIPWHCPVDTVTNVTLLMHMKAYCLTYSVKVWPTHYPLYSSPVSKVTHYDFIWCCYIKIHLRQLRHDTWKITDFDYVLYSINKSKSYHSICRVGSLISALSQYPIFDMF